LGHQWPAGAKERGPKSKKGDAGSGERLSFLGLRMKTSRGGGGGCFAASRKKKRAKCTTPGEKRMDSQVCSQRVGGMMSCLRKVSVGVESEIGRIISGEGWSSHKVSEKGESRHGGPQLKKIELVILGLDKKSFRLSGVGWRGRRGIRVVGKRGKKEGSGICCGGKRAN